jgi:hypothetical protein
MQRIVGMLVVLWGLGWLVSQIPAASESQQERAIPWRRTCDGWEPAERLRSDVLRPQPAFHPAVAGLVLMLFALAALIGLSPEDAVAEKNADSGTQ